ncbi:MAG: MFS transporter [Albidovulum sp.]|nr:MFS transporter [Albidovulum sp.]
MAIFGKRVWGWMHFDWASQPYHTVLTTFIFGPYFASTVAADPTVGQEQWGWMLSASGLLIAALAPILGAWADTAGNRNSWILFFSALYVAGATALWWAAPDTVDATLILLAFAIGLVGVEFATVFTNAILPELGDKNEIGLISGSGWAFGYVGGLTSLLLVLVFFAENDAGRTLAGNLPAFGLDPDAREGTRFSGPFTAVWYVIFMIPFFLWTTRRTGETLVSPNKISTPLLKGAIDGLKGLRRTFASLRRNSSFSAYLVSSMFYRDAFNGIAAFGGIYATGVLKWTIIEVGMFGIAGTVAGAIFAFAGGFADRRYGPKPVIQTCIVILGTATLLICSVSRDEVLLISIDDGSALPDIAFFCFGLVIAATGGVLQSASRTMVVRQSNPERITEGFGLYALSGKATAFLAPFLIALTTALTGDQRLGVTPLVLLFAIGFILMKWVHSDGKYNRGN